ncbi:MAG: glutamine synthetase III [Oscillospiraceae bacterium]|jgi:glutamine synthetase|nr:glutamine synthetase III [Oscillospiraceae bacterium]
MKDVPKLFGSMVFNDSVMREKLPNQTYKALKRTIEQGAGLTVDIANIVASAMKDWAIEKGATHFTHWFQPMTGITAEKHDSFISPVGDGEIIMEFSGKELIKGEPDASSFPSGGLRATFEARGYTAWDPTSYAFIKENTLCIPTAFYSYSGEALDKKTPLLRSIEALSCQALKVLRLIGDTATQRVFPNVGPEQEYFLVPKELFEQRHDLVYTGRTLFGAKPPKGQELEDHYFGSIKPRVMAYMAELDEELWKLGILAKTEHNEVAPAQHELAPIFTSANTACDHNQLTMDIMKKVALRHGLVCLLHEKPFAGVNGSGKHDNWSISTDSGKNLLNPGKEPYKNKKFLLFLSAVIKGVDEYQELLRISAATAGNDHRLGASEAPPAIVSMYLGDELSGILDAIESGAVYSPYEAAEMDTGISSVPNFSKDTTDRNRTSPLAFTGNKFEFRMLGSSMSIADANIILNTVTASALEAFAERLASTSDVEAEVDRIIKDTTVKHKRIVFNGNNYADEWVEEAEKRGLYNLKSTADCLPLLISKKNVDLFERHRVFTEAELTSRYEIMMETYSKVIHIEALTMLDMVRKEILPAALLCTKDAADAAVAKKALSSDINCEYETNLAKGISNLCATISNRAEALDKLLIEGKNYSDAAKSARFHRDMIFSAMQELRAAADELETMVGERYWPYPTYGKLLFGL